MAKARKGDKNILILGTTIVVIIMGFAIWVNSNKANSNSSEQILDIPSTTYSSGKLQIKNWKKYSSKNLGILISYPPDWRVHEFSQDGGNTYILDFDSPDVKSENTYKGGGIEISMYFDSFKKRTNSSLSAEQYIKLKKYQIPYFSEMVYHNGYHAIKFRVDKSDEGEMYFDIPYGDKILNTDIRFTDLNRSQEAQNITDAMLNSLVISPNN